MLKRFSTYSFVAGFMVGVVCVGLFASQGNLFSTASFSHPAPARSAQVTTTAPQSSAVSVADQPAGSSVLVESVTVPPPGVWVAVRELDGDTLGNVLGAARVGAPRSNVTVPLLRATEPGRTYAIELYRDDGTDVFKTTDSVYVDFATSQPVIAHFNTTP